jgi:hypothetical protein
MQQINTIQNRSLIFFNLLYLFKECNFQLLTLLHNAAVNSVAVFTTADGKTLFITGSGDKTMVWSYEHIWSLRFCQAIDPELR